MADAAEQFRGWAAKLLALAIIARDGGKTDYANSLMVMAAHCLDQATALERRRASNAQPGTQYQTTQQQEQQGPIGRENEQNRL